MEDDNDCLLFFYFVFGQINNQGHNFGMFIGKIEILHVLRCLRFTVNDDYFHTFILCFCLQCSSPTKPAQQSPFPWPSPAQKGGGAVIPCWYVIGTYPSRRMAVGDRNMIEEVLKEHGDIFYKLDIQIKVSF